MKKTNLADAVRSIPGFPKQGIIFRDITTLVKDKKAFKESIDALTEKYKNKGIDIVVGVESRGFIFGSAVAYKLGAGFVLVRKKGKLPAKTISATYELEYGTDTLEIHEDAIKPGSKVLIVDDLLATGGTVKAVTGLVGQLMGKIAGIAFVIELVDLKGKEKLKGYPVYSLIKFKGH
ncbi:MAG: adenine phosphoribosyltransferase [Candidatus Omnitrophota bacterium]|nr:adenine phosphoribosyltransferase [Candidatus Omnitrophota bacterium]MBU1929073.1 adenine phosphoribosyltransferase [Candidatus Omnitrophota bacterium]MBU1929176.1 adenine phosphoribosyltransferase [Candidatus Omnitrophota bacterium]MBU2035056.1 adenine phosphoribosyltransferase [Candidatus Omnitrophota bacterium]MBU2258259.1 adenine phosphoribosyltransferase [Candidatus Omnitrophota bacterium]